MNKLDFYKECYYKEVERKNELNSSLSSPIGVLTAFIVSMYYLTTSFDFKFSLINTFFFFLVLTSLLIVIAICFYHLIKSYANFHNGYGYAFLADANTLNSYYNELKEYYIANPNIVDNTDKDFEEYILNELILNTDQNQKNNKSKSYHRYKCQTFLVYSFLLLCITLIPFGFNYGNKENIKNTVGVNLISTPKIKIDNYEVVDKLDSITLKNHKNGR